MDEKKIKENIRRCREECRLTQKELAQKIGVSRNAIVDLESGQTRIFNENLQKIADETSGSLEKLVFGFVPDEFASRKLEESRVEFSHSMNTLKSEYEKRLEEKDRTIAALQKYIARLEEDCEKKDAIIRMSQKND